MRDDSTRPIVKRARSGTHRAADQELHHRLEIDRTRRTRFWANQLRVLLTAAAYVLMQELRTFAGATSCARAQVCTLRARLLKLDVWVTCSVRRIIVLHLPYSSPRRSD